MLTPREKSHLPEKFSPDEDRTRDVASSRTASSTHYQRAIPVPAKCIEMYTLVNEDPFLRHTWHVAWEHHI